MMIAATAVVASEEPAVASFFEKSRAQFVVSSSTIVDTASSTFAFL